MFVRFLIYSLIKVAIYLFIGFNSKIRNIVDGGFGVIFWIILIWFFFISTIGLLQYFSITTIKLDVTKGVMFLVLSFLLEFLIINGGFRFTNLTINSICIVSIGIVLFALFFGNHFYCNIKK